MAERNSSVLSTLRGSSRSQLSLSRPYLRFIVRYFFSLYSASISFNTYSPFWSSKQGGIWWVYHFGHHHMKLKSPVSWKSRFRLNACAHLYHLLDLLSVRFFRIPQEGAFASRSKVLRTLWFWPFSAVLEQLIIGEQCRSDEGRVRVYFAVQNPGLMICEQLLTWSGYSSSTRVLSKHYLPSCTGSERLFWCRATCKRNGMFSKLTCWTAQRRRLCKKGLSIRVSIFTE